MPRVNLDIVRHMPLSAVAVIDLYSVLLITLPFHEPYKRRRSPVVSTRSWRALMCVYANDPRLERNKLPSL